MNNIRNIAFTIGSIMIVLLLINSFSIDVITPTIIRSEVIAGLTSISLILIGFMSESNYIGNSTNINLKGEEGFFIDNSLSESLLSELAWGSQMILTATASSTLLIYINGKTILRRGLISETIFSPGRICESSRKQSKYISLVNTKFYPDRTEFDAILPSLPSVIVFPLLDKGWLIVGGWKERCFTKSDEIWIDGWSKKVGELF